MQPVLTEEQSLALHCFLVKRTHQTIHTQALCQAQLWICGQDTEGFFQTLQPQVEIKNQSGEDLGERMYLAIKEGLQYCQSVVLVGSDCPAISRAYLRSALLALNSVDVVLGPAVDGGYVLIAMKQAERRIFETVDWSTAKVLDQTRKHLKNLDLKWFELPTLMDIDRPSDLAHLDALPCL